MVILEGGGIASSPFFIKNNLNKIIFIKNKIYEPI
jgi:hypothetical protein